MTLNVARQIFVIFLTFIDDSFKFAQLGKCPASNIEFYDLSVIYTHTVTSNQFLNIPTV